MAFDDRIGHESGEWFERYVEDIFRFAGFITERDKLFFTAVKHEIDVWAESEFARIAVECKDWQYLQPGNIKKEFDAFIAKVKQVGADAGVFAVNVPDRGQLSRFRQYLKGNGLTLWDSKDVDRWHELVSRYKDRTDYQKKLCDSIGVVIRAPSQTEKTFGFLRSFGKVAAQTVKAGADFTVKAASQIEFDDERPHRRRRRHKSK